MFAKAIIMSIKTVSFRPDFILRYNNTKNSNNKVHFDM
jgi:hypothetical protein